MLDPTADNTDTYAFTAKDAPGSVTIVANWIPGEVPANGPNFFRFDDRAAYYINIDNTGDGKADIRTGSSSRRRSATGTRSCTRGPSTTSYDKLNVIQTYSIIRETVKYKAKYKGKGKQKRKVKVARVSYKTIARNLPVAPPNIGPKTFPNYQTFANGAIST